MEKKFLDYFKDVFNLSLKHKFIFVPSILINFVPMLFLMAYALLIAGSFSLMSVNSIISSLFSGISVIFGIIIAFGLAVLSLMFKSGTLYLEKKLVKGNNDINWKSFWIGAKKYPVKLFVGNLVIGVLVILAFLPVGILFLVIPQIASVFVIIAVLLMVAAFIAISFWEKILVYDDLDVMHSIKKSIAFVKLNILPTIGLLIIQAIVTYDNDKKDKSGHDENMIDKFKPDIGNNSIANYTSDFVLPIGSISVISIIIILVQILLTVFMETVFMNYYHFNKECVDSFEPSRNDLF
ncbi:MAG: hypothetical protein ACQEQE_07500 [Bacillota bacterium]